MSGGTFDYKQYILEEITDTIEEIIRESEKEKPIKLKKLGIASYKIISDIPYITPLTTFIAP